MDLDELHRVMEERREDEKEQPWQSNRPALPTANTNAKLSLQALEIFDQDDAKLRKAVDVLAVAFRLEPGRQAFKKLVIRVRNVRTIGRHWQAFRKRKAAVCQQYVKFWTAVEMAPGFSRTAPAVVNEAADRDEYLPIWTVIGRPVPLKCKQRIVAVLWRQHRIVHERKWHATYRAQAAPRAVLSWLGVRDDSADRDTVIQSLFRPAASFFTVTASSRLHWLKIVAQGAGGEAPASPSSRGDSMPPSPRKPESPQALHPSPKAAASPRKDLASLCQALLDDGAPRSPGSTGTGDAAAATPKAGRGASQRNLMNSESSVGPGQSRMAFNVSWLESCDSFYDSGEDSEGENPPEPLEHLYSDIKEYRRDAKLHLQQPFRSASEIISANALGGAGARSMRALKAKWVSPRAPPQKPMPT